MRTFTSYKQDVDSSERDSIIRMAHNGRFGPTPSLFFASQTLSNRVEIEHDKEMNDH